MSAEEEEIIDEEVQTPIQSVEDQLTPENAKPTKLNKNGKPRKILSPEALEKLRLAREKANAIRKESYTKKLEEKVEKLKSVKPNEGGQEIQEEIPEEKVIKPKGKKKTKIIIEQSSDDSDEFEDNKNVIFVKRASRKKKEVPVVPEPQLQMELPPPEPPIRPPPRQLTPQELALKNQYNNMFSGGFMNKRNYY
jgi:hypothetical protein